MKSTIRFSTQGLKTGDHGLYAKEAGRLSARQLEAGRRVLRKSLQGSGQMWVRVVADRPVSAKPSEVRMGKGKGAISHYVARVKAGQMIYEVQGVSKEEAFRALERASKKIPISMGQRSRLGSL